MNKPNCYQCKHRQDLAGSAHSSCEHPALKDGVTPILALLATLHSSQRGGPIAVGNGGFTVKGNQHGIKNGWFMHPLNFDPSWVEECNGFESKQSSAVSGAVSKAA